MDVYYSDPPHPDSGVEPDFGLLAERERVKPPFEDALRMYFRFLLQRTVPTVEFESAAVAILCAPVVDEMVRYHVQGLYFPAEFLESLDQSGEAPHEPPVAVFDRKTLFRRFDPVWRRDREKLAKEGKTSTVTTEEALDYIITYQIAEPLSWEEVIRRVVALRMKVLDDYTAEWQRLVFDSSIQSKDQFLEVLEDLFAEQEGFVVRTFNDRYKILFKQPDLDNPLIRDAVLKLDQFAIKANEMYKNFIFSDEESGKEIFDFQAFGETVKEALSLIASLH